MYLIWIISLSLLMVYMLRIFTFYLGWRRIDQENSGVGGLSDIPAKQGKPPAVSLVIPVRNEEQNINALLKDLLNQDYPAENFEVIIIDDHSEDQTKELLRIIEAGLSQDLPLQSPRVRILALAVTESGKKAALQKGINAASHPLILNCDGDCRVPSRWVAQMAERFSDDELKMLIGAVVFEPDRKFFHAMQSIEFFSLTAAAAGSAGLKSPVLCNAANLAYYKADYLDFIKDHAKVSESGDDIFLLLWMKKKFPASIRFSASMDTLVRTMPAMTVSSFFMQRLRWTSKSGNYRDFNMIFTALLTYAMSAMMLGLLLLGCFISEFIKLFAILLVLKSAIDLLLLTPVLRNFKKAHLLRYFIPMEIVYFMYVSFVGFFGQFLSFNWKGRKIRHIN